MNHTSGPADLALKGNLAIRPMQPRDIDGVLAIERVVYPRPWTSQLFLAELGQKDRTYLVASTVGPRQLRRRREVVLGYAGIQVIAGEAHVVTVASHPAWRRVGIGARLVLALLEEAVALQAQDVTLEVRDSNHGARALYASFGFEDAGARPGYYADNREDARILWLRGLHRQETRAIVAREAHRRGLPVPSALRPDA